MIKLCIVDLRVCKKKLPISFNNTLYCYGTTVKEKRIYQSMLAQLLLRYMMQYYFRQLTPDIDYTLQGKPFFKSSSYFFNISHSHDVVLVGVGDAELGVDIEYIRERGNLLSIAKQFFHADELYMLQRCDGIKRLELFYEIWTKKESCVKCSGDGIGKLLFASSIFSPVLTGIHTIYIKKYYLKGYACAVASYRDHLPDEYKRIELKSLIDY